MTQNLQVFYYNTFLTMAMGEGMVSRQFLQAARRLDGWNLVTVPPVNKNNHVGSKGVNIQKRRRSGWRQKVKWLAPPSVRKALRSFMSPMSSYPLGPYLYKRRMMAQIETVLKTYPNFDLMLLHLSQGDLTTLATLCRRSQAPIVLRAPGPFAYQADAVFQRFMSVRDRKNERFLYQRADAICVISEHMKQLMVRETGVCAEKVFSVPNGIDFAKFDPAQMDRKQMRHKLGLEGRQVVGYVGGFWPGNDLDTLLHAWRGVEKATPEATLLLVGHGPGRAQAQALSQHLGLQNCVWVDRVLHSEVPHYIAAMDVAVGPYVEAALEFVSPLKVMEYMAMEAPVVATDGGQIAELVENGTTGYLYPAGSASELEAAILALLQQPATAVSMGRRARQHILDWYSWNDIAGRMMTICKQVVS